MNLIGNTTGTLTRKIDTSRRGEPLYAAESEIVRCDLIQLRAQVAPTSVRTDHSATHGNAEEQVADARVLFRVETHPQRGDRLIDREFNLIGQEIERDRSGRQPPGQCDDQNDQQAGQHRRTLKAQDQRSAAAMPETAQPQITGRDIVFPSSIIGGGVSRRVGDIMMFINHVLSMVL